ncbi:DUF4440 domain-containing protein [Xanthomonas albilineans]|uniref:DUF4440 domain-containing protein n=1 Tax=Xanthomonas albilineans (strain GPE PC73 / CFBP 7063) TaxID=380358 RepID=D2UBY5_XANAP|nr:DUF4440 domain-containing protein [Xanthomonas albilineans]QHQ27335.1 DUF4440 domain-containing protein [Xanthomonas albilineans]CBA15127.1 hypothetical protein XALC_0607 [Xanthomonas albilineans GPE PC73]
MDAALPRELVGLELALLEPVLRASSERVADLLDDAFLEFGTSGRRFDKHAVLHALSVEVSWFADRVFDMDAQLLAPDLAQLRDRSERSGRDEPPRQTLRSSLWQRWDGQWRMLFHQGTPIPGVV